MNKILAALVSGLFAAGVFAASHAGAPMAAASGAKAGAPAKAASGAKAPASAASAKK
jgi:hypothetical protein